MFNDMETLILKAIVKSFRVSNRICVWLFVACVAIASVSSPVHGREKRFESSVSASGQDYGFISHSFCVSPDGKKIVFATNSENVWHLYQLNIATRSVKQLTSSKYGEAYPSMSRNGNLLTYVKFIDTRGRQSIEVRNLVTSKETTVMSAVNGDVMYPTLSRDGSRLVFARTEGFNNERTKDLTGVGVYVYSTHTKSLRCILKTKNSTIESIFSPDGKYVYTSDITGDPTKDETIRLVAIPANGISKTRVLSSEPSFNFSPCLVDHDRNIMYAHNNGSGAICLFKVSRFGGAPVQITELGEGGGNLVSTIDEKHLFYLDENSGHFGGIYEVNHDGTERQQVADGSLFSDPLHWHGVPK